MDNEVKLLTKFFGKNIQQRRKALAITQEILAERVRVSQKAISRMEQGKIAPKFERLQPLASALECQVVDLFTLPESSSKASAATLEEFMQPLNSKQRAFVLDQIRLLTDFLISKDDS